MPLTIWIQTVLNCLFHTVSLYRLVCIYFNQFTKFYYPTCYTPLKGHLSVFQDTLTSEKGYQVVFRYIGSVRVRARARVCVFVWSLWFPESGMNPNHGEGLSDTDRN